MCDLLANNCTIRKKKVPVVTETQPKKIDSKAKNRQSLSPGIHIFSVSIVIISTGLLCQMQANFFGAEFLSTISKFMKRMNFVTACLRPTQNMKLGIFTGSRAVDGKEMYKKV